MNKYKIDYHFERFENYVKLFLYYQCINIEIPFLLNHPLINSSTYFVDNSLISINKDNFEDIINLIIQDLKEIYYTQFEDNEIFQNNIIRIILMINKPYKIPIFQIFSDLLNKKNYNELLNHIWTITEYPHQNKVKDLKKLFNKIDKNYFMSQDDLKIYKSLPDKVVIYRGVQGDKAKIRGFSWTLDLNIAKWFSNRFNNKNNVYKAVINKKNVYAYVSDRGEKEIIVNPNCLKNVEKF